MPNRARILSITLGVALVLALVAAPSFGATVTYSDNTSWTAATSNQTSISFSGLAPTGSFTDYGTSTGLVSSGVTFLGYLSPTAYMLAVVDSMFASPYYNFGSGGSLRGPVNDRASTSAFLPYIQVNLPASVTGFAVDLMTISPNALPFTITLADGETFTVNTGNRPNTAFFGLTTTSAIAYIDFALPTSSINGGTYALLKDFQYSTSSSQSQGTPGQTPEAATLIMIGTGLVFFRYLKKWGLSQRFVHAS
jgi:EamA domain-containing membrane protein RarD